MTSAAAGWTTDGFILTQSGSALQAAAVAAAAGDVRLDNRLLAASGSGRRTWRQDRSRKLPSAAEGRVK